MRAKNLLAGIALALAIAAHPGLSAPASPAVPTLARPAKGLGSPRLTAVAIRQEARIYKRTRQADLVAHLFLPPGWSPSDRRPAIVFFFGGGWRNGTPAQFFPQAEYFAARGIVCATVEYRILSKHGTTPDVCVQDGRSAVRWIRAQAATLGVDPRRVVAAGASAGAHVAAATLLEGFDDEADNLALSCRPDALLLFNPPLDLTGIGTRDMKAAPIERELSPLFAVRPGLPPAILFYGSADPLMKHGVAFREKSRAAGNRCDLYSAAGEPHGFFNHEPWLTSTVRQADMFLRSVGYLPDTPPLPAPAQGGVLTAP